MWNSQEKEAFLKTLEGSVPYLTEEKKGRLLTYAAYVVEQNEMINLTAITKPEEFAIKHIIDSLMVLEHVDLAGKTVIDVGTGAGMPGLKVLGGEISEIASYDLPQGMGSRSLIMVKKVAQTPKTYPRKAGTPNKTPL